MLSPQDLWSAKCSENEVFGTPYNAKNLVKQLTYVELGFKSVTEIIAFEINIATVYKIICYIVNVAGCGRFALIRLNFQI